MYGALGTSHLYDPALYEFTFLSGITAVDDAFGREHELFYRVELFLHPFIRLQLDAEALWNHGQLRHAPRFPHG